MAMNLKIITGEQAIFTHCILKFFTKIRREKNVKIYCLYWSGSHTVPG